jgi:alkylation response protein AidB-like acyl-CoA dehydrogenase
MDLSFSDSERAFQREVRAWFAAHTPAHLRRKVVTGQMLNKDDIVQWQRRLDEQGYLVVGWPQPMRPWACRWASSCSGRC